jgi:hypothetical protein
MIVALAAIVESLRQILSFYQRKLAIKRVTAKNKRRPAIYWPSKNLATAEPPDPLAAA